MTGAKRRSFQAEIAIKYCGVSARKAEEILGWGRANVELGLAEKRTGITCVGAQSMTSGAKLWEEKHPEIAVRLKQLAESYAQQDPTFESTIAYTRLTSSEAIKQLKAQGFAEDNLPAPSTMALVLNRMGYRLRKVLKAKPQKKIAETDDIFNNIKEKDKTQVGVKRLSIDCKATVHIGEYARGGKTRGNNQALDHDMGCTEKYIPFGIVDEDSGQLFITFGSSYKTSDFIVDSIKAYWDSISDDEKNGPEKTPIQN